MSDVLNLWLHVNHERDRQDQLLIIFTGLIILQRKAKNSNNITDKTLKL